MSVDSTVHVHTYTVCTYVRTQTRSAKTIVSLLFPVQLNCTFENYKLRSRSKKQYKPPVKRARYNSSDEDDKAMPGEGSLPSQPPVKRGRGQGSRGRGGGRAGRGSQGHGRGYEGRGRRVRGIGRGMRGRGVYGRGRGCRGDGASGRSKKAGSGGLPTGATPLAPRILSTKTRMVFALCTMMVRTFQPELKLVHLNCLSSFSMIALRTEYCDAHMHTLRQRKQAKRDDTSSS